MGSEPEVFDKTIVIKAELPGDVQIRYRIKDANTGEYTSGYSPSFTLHLVPKLEFRTPNPQDDTATFNVADPGVLVIEAGVDVTPNSSASNLVWDITTMQGSSVQILPIPNPSPPDPSDSAHFIFTTLPDQSEFDKDKYVYASLPAWNVIDSVQVYFFFSKYDGTNFARNHPGPSYAIDYPNWFFYWKQTVAGDPTVISKYDATNDTSRGTYTLGQGHLKICSLATETTHLVCSYPVYPGPQYDGIDNFAITMRHEKGHYDDYRDLWHIPGGGYNPLVDNDPHTPTNGDQVPDSLEGIGRTYPQFDSLKWDSINDPWTIFDFDFLGYERECTDWNQGDADDEDWANPGHNYPPVP